MDIKTTNTILYCWKWNETVEFYQSVLSFPISFSCEWFVEFIINASSRISVADENRASIKSCSGGGITISLEVRDIEKTYEAMQQSGISLGPILDHPWNAKRFHIFDPEGNRIEIWSKLGEFEQVD